MEYGGPQLKLGGVIDAFEGGRGHHQHAASKSNDLMVMTAE